jgi:hypothetical protein
LPLSSTDGKQALPFNEKVAAEWLKAIFGKWLVSCSHRFYITLESGTYWLCCPNNAFIDLNQ